MHACTHGHTHTHTRSHTHGHTHVHTHRISVSSPSSNSESKGLVVYGASGLASQRNHTPNHTPNHKFITEVVVHDANPVRARSEEPRRSHDINSLMYDKNHVSHDSITSSHDSRSPDPVSMSHDHMSDSVEVKTLASLSNHSQYSQGQRSQGVSPKISNDHYSESQHTRSHDRHVTGHRRSSEPTSPSSASHDNSPHRRTSALSPSHDSHMFKRYELGPPSKRRSSRDHIPLSPEHDSHVTNHYDNHRSPERTSHHRVRRSSREESPKSSSLTRHAYPDYTLAEDREWEGYNEVVNEGATQHFPRVIDPAAKPKNRIRLSLPESSFYDSQYRRGTRLTLSGRRSRNTTISTTTTSLSQPLDSNNILVI